MPDMSNCRLKNKPSGGNQNRLDNVIIQDCCANEDNYDKNNHENNLLQNAMQQDIGSPTTLWNVSVLCFSLSWMNLVKCQISYISFCTVNLEYRALMELDCIITYC
mgnify:CR=1 FL=1|jgi:hypothetical protein